MGHSPAVCCHLCGDPDTRLFTHKDGYTLYRCGSCEFLFVDPLPSAVAVYNKSYFAGADEGYGYVDYDTDKEPMIPTFEKYLDFLNQFGARTGKLLDVGCATGFFMEIAKRRGFDVSGVELSEFASEQGRSKGLSILTSTLEAAEFPAGSFDVVTMCDVLEHVEDPKGFLSEALRVLRPGGFLVINTPNAGSRIAKLFGRSWHLLVPPEHLHYFSARNLGEYLQRDGFRVLMSKSVGKRFTLAYIFKTLYKWQRLKVWDGCARIFSKPALASWSIPLNTHDNVFVIAEKMDSSKGNR